MSKYSQAKERFLLVTYKHNVKTIDNFEAIAKLAQMIADAEAVGFKLDPDSVEEAVKRVLGV